MSSVAPDVNEPAWDPRRDSANERRSLLRNLDPIQLSSTLELFDPDRRRIGGLTLGERNRALLLGCGVEDLEVLANEINARAGLDDDSEERALREAGDELEALLGRYRQAPSESDERVLGRMPVGVRRQARQLQLTVEALQLKRYDPAALRQRYLQSRLKPQA